MRSLSERIAIRNTYRDLLRLQRPGLCRVTAPLECPRENVIGLPMRVLGSGSLTLLSGDWMVGMLPIECRDLGKLAWVDDVRDVSAVLL